MSRRPRAAAAYNDRVSFSIRAITLDLDDTLWPFPPIGERIERVLDDWFRTHSPRTAELFPIPAMRRLREEVIARHPRQAHDASWLRRRGIEIALAESGGDPALADAAYAAFHSERNRVEFYAEARDALARVAARVPLCALTNGNADLDAIGIGHLFAHRLSARQFGSGKPDAAIFHHACALLGTDPADTLHVGDDVDSDIVGAAHAGLRTCWIRREDNRHVQWPARPIHPDLIVPDLAALAQRLEAHAHRETSQP